MPIHRSAVPAAEPTRAVPPAVALPTPGRPVLAPLRGRTALFLHAHPDDEAIFTAVTMRRLADLGARVVLVTATGGELGTPRVALAPGETLRSRRLRELETAAAALGVARLVVLGHRDSGMPGWPSGRPRGGGGGGGPRR